MKFIFEDIDCIATKNVDEERSLALIEKRYSITSELRVTLS